MEHSIVNPESKLNAEIAVPHAPHRPEPHPVPHPAPSVILEKKSAEENQVWEFEETK